MASAKTKIRARLDRKPQEDTFKEINIHGRTLSTTPPPPEWTALTDKQRKKFGDEDGRLFFMLIKGKPITLDAYLNQGKRAYKKQQKELAQAAIALERSVSHVEPSSTPESPQCGQSHHLS